MSEKEKKAKKEESQEIGKVDNTSDSSDRLDDVSDVGEEIGGLFFKVFLKVLPDEIIASHQFDRDFEEVMTEEDHEKVSEIIKQPIEDILELIRQRIKSS